MNSLVTWMFVTVMVTTVEGKGKSNDKPKNEYAYSKEEQFSSPDVFWPIHSSLHGNGAPASSITALLHSAGVGTGEGNLGAAELTGTSDSYIQIPNTGDLDGREAFCWIFNLYPTSSQTATILEYAGVGGTGNGVKLTQDGTTLIATVYDVTGAYYGSYERNILTINTWNFVGFSYNKIWGIIDIFKDDNIAYTITGVTMKDVNAVGDVSIGRSVDGTGNFQGKVSCIQFYKKALFKGALNNPPTYCDLTIWDPSVLDWSEDFIPTTTTTTSTATTTTTSTTTTPTPTTTAQTITTTTTPRTTPIVTTTPIVITTTATAAPTTMTIPAPTASTSLIITPTTTPATNTTQIVITTTTTVETTTQSTTPTPTTTISPTSAASASSAVTMSATTPTTSTIPITASTATGTQAAASGSTLKETTPPILTSATTQTTSSFGLSQTSTQPQTSGFIRGDQSTLTDTCYFFNIWVRNHDFQSPGDVIALSNDRTFTECVHMCTGNTRCLVFVFHDNGECKVGATSSPSLWTTATMSSRVYKMVHLDTNKYFHAP